MITPPLFSSTEIPTVGVLGPLIRVGTEAFGDDNCINLKYAVYIIGGLEVGEIEKYPPLRALARALDKPGIHEALFELIVSFFKMLRQKVDHHCKNQILAYSGLAFTIPF